MFQHFRQLKVGHRGSGTVALTIHFMNRVSKNQPYSHLLCVDTEMVNVNGRGDYRISMYDVNKRIIAVARQMQLNWIDLATSPEVSYRRRYSHANNVESASAGVQKDGRSKL